MICSWRKQSAEGGAFGSVFGLGLLEGSGRSIQEYNALYALIYFTGLYSIVYSTLYYDLGLVSCGSELLL